MQAMVAVCGERGYASATVTVVCERAHVSRRSFYREFDDLQACFLAVLDDGCRRAADLIASAFRSAGGDAGAYAAMSGVRMALAALLCFMDERPQLAHVWLIESLVAGSWAIQRRERNVAALTRQIVEYWRTQGQQAGGPLLAAGAMDGVLGLLRRRMITNSGEPLIELLAPLMEIVSAPYLDADGVAEQVRQARAHALNTPPTRRHEDVFAPARGEELGPLAPGVKDNPQLPASLLDPRARRARECVLYVAWHPGASNRRIADGIGVASHTQISALLTRLERLGLLCAARGAPGHPNSWRLSPYGTSIAAVLDTSEGCHINPREVRGRRSSVTS